MDLSSLIPIITIALSVCIPVVVIGIVAVAFGPRLFGMLRSGAGAQKALQSGVDATAVITRTWDTGMRINDNPRVGMQLQVQPPNGALFQVDVEQTVSIVHMPMYQPGVNLQVKYDPANPKNIAIVGVLGGGAGASALGGGMAIGQPQAEQIMQQMKAVQDALVNSPTAPARVLQYQPLGFDVNGGNPAVRLQVEVQPATGPKFNAQVQGVIGVAATAKFQAGQMITVHYNPNDFTQVDIAHSGL